MQTYPFSKKPAFFPYMSAEVFFEANEAAPETTKNDALDHELEKILGLNASASMDSERDSQILTA